MLISKLMERTGVSRDTLRHYESIGLLHNAHFYRRKNGYRDYNESAVQRINFVKKAQRAGFTLNQIGQVADEWESNELSTEDKKMILSKQITSIDQHIDNLRALQDEIRAMIADL